MKLLHFNLLRLAFVSCSYLFFISCSKDADLLSDYVVSKDGDLQNLALLVDDRFSMAPGQNSKVLDVLSNDSFSPDAELTIVSTSTPNNGEIIINEDNTLTYTLYVPKEDETTATTNDEVEDSFVYTAEVTSDDGTVISEEANVVVNSSRATEELNSNVQEWKAKFDSYWKNTNYDFSKISTHSRSAINAAKSGNFQQEYYFLGYYIDGLIQIWQATGDNFYLDEALELIHITINKAVEVNGGYLGWPANIDDNGVALWDSYYWRYVSTLTRIMHKSPNLRTESNGNGGTYQDDYEKLLSFGEENIWNRYESYGLNNFYRSNTHMASHWARIGMDFYIITGKQKYKEIFDNISFGTMVNRPSNLRNQFYQNPKNASSVLWSHIWGASQDELVQDTSHAGAIVSFIVSAYTNQMYWSKQDIDALIVTLDQFVWKDSDKAEVRKRIDGSHGYHSPGGRLHEWLTLGRYSTDLQNKIKSNYIGKNFNYYATHFFGIAALNAKILADGKPVYPEIQ